jgi:transporter family-2 protein
LQSQGIGFQLGVMYLFFLFLATLAGACISVQAAANGSLRGNLDDGRWATFFSICGTIVTAVLVMLAIRPSAPTEAAIRSTSWWNWIGGPLGAIIVFSGATLTPKLGAASFIASIVAGQLLSSILLDHLGWMNLPQQPITFSRGFGVLLVFAGMVLITRRV